MVKQINELYEKAAADGFYSWNESARDFDRVLENMPQRAWLE
jgi:hypothetical protein